MTDRKRALSYSQARTCEEACQPRCTCRCGGTLHGAKRGDVRGLPLEDPHAVRRVCLKCQGSGKLLNDLPCWKCHGQGSVLVRSA